MTDAMKRVVDTSAGRVVLEFHPTGLLDAALLDEHGWEQKKSEGDFDEYWGINDVAVAVIDVASVPQDEAEAIERQILTEFEERGGWRAPDDSEYPSALSRVLAFGLIGFLLTALVIGLGTIVWFLWNVG